MVDIVANDQFGLTFDKDKGFAFISMRLKREAVTIIDGNLLESRSFPDPRVF
jgi:hypothetical protein